MSLLTVEHRAEQVALRQVTKAEFRALWPELDLRRLDGSWPAFEQAVLELVRRQRRVSSLLAADYLRAVQAEAGLLGAAVLTAGDVPAEAVSTSLRSTTVVPVKKATAAGVLLEVAGRNALTMAEGAVARHVLDAGRETVVGSVLAEPRARGWRRVTRPGSCNFCRMLAGRGAVYREDTSAFRSHDHCGCAAEPVYRTGD